MDDPIYYELRVISIATCTSVKCYSPKSFPSFKASLELSFSSIKNTRSHIAKTVRDFCSAHHMQLLSRPAYSPDISPIEHVLDWVGRRLARDPRPTASKDALFAAQTGNMEANIQNLFDSRPRRLTALIIVRGGCAKY
ncbi:transposable element Tcb2 transposase [Trichonephila clavipes]|uniref:Transposable element Tcb2 transposase n=1 Tax=Trichonephila clavipes TaxID=2585209 RepID=A0A8X6V814_TRICX|nr:transposable element Tcb2 transposase [Trichonephila clavipes]